MAKDTLQREDDKIASERPKQHTKLVKHSFLRDEAENAEADYNITRVKESSFYRSDEYEKNIRKGIRDPELIKHKLDEQKKVVEKYRLDHKEEVGSAISTPRLKPAKYKIGDINPQGDCPSGDCPDQEMMTGLSGTANPDENNFLFYGNFDGTLYKSAFEWCLEDNQMFNSVEILSTFPHDAILKKWESTGLEGRDQKGESWFGGIIGTNKQKTFDDCLWRNPVEFKRNGKIQGKHCHWDWITTFKFDYGFDKDKKFVRLNGWNSEWGCLVWNLRDNDLVETMPILLWGDTSVGETFANAFQRTHAFDDDPNKDAREDVQEYVESYNGQEPLIIINTDPHTDHPLLDYTNIESRHVFMDISCRDTPSPFLEAGKSNGNETIDTLGFLMYRLMTDWNNILWMKAYKHIDTKRCIAYLRELVEYNAK